jgi:Uma2 family endonuclease
VAPFDVRLPKGALPDEAIDTVVQPDISVVCDESRLDERGCVGGPDWIIEVLSPASSAHDQIRKRNLYERAGVRHYWLVHPRDHILTRYRLTATGYGKPQLQETVGTTEIDLSPLLNIDWTWVFPDTTRGGGEGSGTHGEGGT